MLFERHESGIHVVSAEPGWRFEAGRGADGRAWRASESRDGLGRCPRGSRLGRSYGRSYCMLAIHSAAVSVSG